MKSAAILFPVLLLAGCAAQPVEIPKEVPVPVPVPCVAEKDVPKPPVVLSQAELMLLNDYQRTLQLWLDRWALDTYQQQLEAIAARCSRLQPIPATTGRHNGPG